ncbi:solute carrier family 29 (equilibrative nucleoside transporter), member 4 [Capronia coronata CBS 617.96]|uniref:Solute carrier family 29 (Equilibrative nucleoside transporter), member 4 n=1 Tax=Capronia coronata CBS 617.96 TaxID=1182541 RepID=W9YS87_9EURO|nr:solute carrier family 29 (equilibrative nucleoside transporter), member 4 [Capronia coronata CBS 617.96]EXJ95378.1 solute carrier family 29 (equilibrative nucleoside transporter), member 4 [Capronia coronata CBS 617.96]
MDRVKRFFRSGPEYEPIHTDVERDEESIHNESEDEEATAPFSWVEYAIFLLLGIAMLWAWNMFLAAAPYFQHRFRTSEWILNHFQAAEISVSTVTNLTSMTALTKIQKGASYPKRITASLLINTVVFGILSLSTLVPAPAGVYFGFLLIAIFCASFSTGLIQNGLFSFASGFGRSEYTQAIMTGQAVAGVLPPLAQIISVVAVPAKKAGDPGSADESPTSALVYFLTATAISIISLFAFFYLLRKESQARALRAASKSTADETNEDLEPNERPEVPLTTLFKKLPFLSAAVFVCFGVTMVFPVFTASIRSVRGIDSAVFIPTAFLLWNIGDLLGRLATLWKRISLTHYPFALFCLAVARLLFIPLYFLCNIKGRGAVVQSDFFYLVVVQFLFGLTNGYLGSECMMGSGDWVAPEEREAAGGFMGLMLVGGLTVGSLLSFLLGDV